MGFKWLEHLLTEPTLDESLHDTKMQQKISYEHYIDTCMMFYIQYTCIFVSWEIFCLKGEVFLYEQQSFSGTVNFYDNFSFLQLKKMVGFFLICWQISSDYKKSNYILNNLLQYCQLFTSIS